MSNFWTGFVPVILLLLSSSTSRRFKKYDFGLDRIDACKCGCNFGEPFCYTERTRECEQDCNERCKIGEHTMDDDGKCNDKYNCTCIVDEEKDDPICCMGRGKFVSYKTFKNIRWVHCQNLCLEDEWEVVAEGTCREYKEFNDIE